MKKLYYSALLLGSISLTNAQVFDTTEFGFMTDVSNNGVAVGSVMYSNQIMWTEAGGVVVIGEPSNGEQISGNTSVSSDGKYISGTMTNPDTMINEMAHYNVETSTWKYLGNIVAGQESTAFGMTSDGTAVVGLGFLNAMEAHAIKWTEAGGLVDLGSTNPETSSRANGINDDGTVIVGWQDDDFDRLGVYWKNGVQNYIKDTDGNKVGEAFSVTPNGKTIIGANYDYPYIWDETEGYLELTHEDPMYEGSATGITDDGKTVVGFFRQWGTGAFSGSGFIWTREGGRIDLNEYAESLGYDTKGINFSLPLAISPNGQYIVGVGLKDSSEIMGFVIKLPESNMATSNVNVDKVKLYPNPAKDIINLTNVDKQDTIEIYNLVGQKVITEKNTGSNQINISKLSKGTYILKVLKNGKEESIKFVKG